MKEGIAALVDEIERYASCRLLDVTRGAETPAFAAFMVEKFGEGLLKAANLLQVEREDELKRAIGRLVKEIDAQYPTHLQYRFEARPAGLAINGIAH
ncbi:MAG: hypothetical protein JWR14_6292 [Caballeronia sp.]|jgi:hypothetical protein|uniref:hypothetical protein n=1 Tax=Caballeronia sp. TaxID=1931223 RepID=UPI002616A4AE|nr:hypothetical protein [Caballeronia sp.]MDB5836462.1 hypothetical protein [Caballeronia sp.]